jgi:hypothetical protein
MQLLHGTECLAKLHFAFPYRIGAEWVTWVSEPEIFWSQELQRLAEAAGVPE